MSSFEPGASCDGGTDPSAIACFRIGLQPTDVAWTDLAAPEEDRPPRSVDHRRDRRRQALRAEQTLDAVPVELEADEAARRTAGSPFALERKPADEVGLVEGDEPAEPDLERAVALLRVHRVTGRGVVDLEQDQARLQPDDVEREHPGRADRVVLAGRPQRVPERDGPPGVDPQLIAEVAGVARARDVDRDLPATGPDRRGATPEVAQVVEGLARGRLEDRPRVRALERDRGRPLGDVVDRDVEAGGVHPQPAELRIRRGPAERAVIEGVDGPVVDHLAVLVAPRRVDHSTGAELRRVAGDHAIDETPRVRAPDDVLVERTDVDERGGLADRVVLDVVGVGVGRRGEVARPLAPLLLAVQRGGDGMERGADAHAPEDTGRRRPSCTR
jgi:hypothetical protein